MRSTPHVWSARLAPAPAAARTGRRAVTELLEAADATELAPDAGLLISELLANVVLHARTDAVVRASVRHGSLLVEVTDGSPVIPAPLARDLNRPTGRGLALVDALATSWGAVPTASGGKVIWFELGDGHGRPPGKPAAATERISICLLDTPVLLGLATLDQGAAVRRELDLRALAGTASEAGLPVDRYVDLTTVRTQLEDARGLGLASLDVEVEVADQATWAALSHLALVEEGDRMSREGELLVAPSIPEVARCRQWLLTQISWQLKGAAATPWQPEPEPIEHTTPLLPIDPQLAAELSDRLGAVVLADGDNRILHLDADAEALLGWTSLELRGRRLTRIIPPRLRDAHLAGFVRHSLEGSTTILDTPTLMPALTRWGEEIEVDLLVEEVSELSGRRLYRGTLTPRAVPPA